MDIPGQIKNYIASQPEPKRTDLESLHKRITGIMPQCKLWFLDGKDDTGKTVSNPNIGYGLQLIHYADGQSKDFYQIGISPNSTGISVYIIGIPDKTYLPQTYGSRIGKAKISGYCIRFKTLKDIHTDMLEAAIRDGIQQTSK